jgi:acyl-CoA reductase-like NAD-dependent aldehyde dehydrogenase
MIGAQASNDQLEKILSYLDIGRQEGAKVLTGGERIDYDGELKGGYYVQPTIFEGDNRMRIFQEEIFGPVVSVTSFDDFDDAIKVANDTLYGLGAGVWTRDINTAYRAGRAIQAGRVWTNCYHAYPAHAAFGGYKQSGIGRENHKMMLDHYQQTKNLLVRTPEEAWVLLEGRSGKPPGTEEGSDRPIRQGQSSAGRRAGLYALDSAVREGVGPVGNIMPGPRDSGCQVSNDR